MKSAIAPTRHSRRRKSVTTSAKQNNTMGTLVTEFQQATLQYNTMRAHLVRALPNLKDELPQEWPQGKPIIDSKKTIMALRDATSTLNEGLLIVGFGDGSIINYLRQDPNGRRKLVNILVLDGEAEALAYALGALDIQSAFKELNLDIHFIKNPNNLAQAMSTMFNNHGQIARLAGTTILDTHPLLPEAEKNRQAWVPYLKKIILERYDCLGNDVYDTFLGAKHALMHGDKLIRQRRSSDYSMRYAGKSALCIASGPSVVDYYEHIRAIQHEHVVICADSILGGLLDHGIEPDFVCMVERPDNMHRLIDEHASKCKTMMVALPVVHPTSVIPFDDRVMWWWNADDLYPWLDPKEQILHSGRSAGTLTVALATQLGVKTAYLIGHDLAFIGGQSHGAGANPLAFETQKTINRELSRTNPNYYRRILDVDKNGGEKLETMGIWDIFRSDLEGIVQAYSVRTSFVNLNIVKKVGAKIAGSVEGELPGVNGCPLEKSHPNKEFNEESWQSYKKRGLTLKEDFESIKKKFADIEAELKLWRPLSYDRKAVENMGNRVDITKIVSDENKAWFGYVFRAALRNLMVRLHHNTYVRTMAERNWNQVQIIRLYVQSVPALLNRLQPELDKALETFND